MKNKGKEFEQDFHESCLLQKIWIERLNDTSLSWLKEKEAKFTPSNISDFLVFKKPHLYVVECKSTTYKSISFQTEEDVIAKRDKMIKMSQIKSLIKASMEEGIFAGFLLNFRNDLDIKDNSVYWLDISDFCQFLKENDKKSINESDCVKYNGILIGQKLKRVHFNYDIINLLPNIIKRGEEIEKRTQEFISDGINHIDFFVDNPDEINIDE